MITAAACRAARGLLDWTVEQLAQESRLEVATVRAIEDGTADGGSWVGRRLVDAFARHRVEITHDDRFTGARIDVRLGRIADLRRSRDVMQAQVEQGQRDRASPALLDHGLRAIDEIDAQLAALEAELRD